MKLKILIFSLLLAVFFSSEVAFARQIGYFTNFKVDYSSTGQESLTGSRTKAVTNRRGAINLSDDTGSAWITATMRNSNGAYRGRTDVQRGKRATFATPGAEATYNYRLGLKKTNNTGGGTVRITGSWSPDER
ncbi:hypothetical protein [Vagococcus salmoninarum]|uniref:hypothetical protein n=1 Tax=Vagococcus salmoninarum TaxID=2739 RepID=UPI0028D1C6E4|nr:hypothetical protein [Vagococcus salmoninarum]